MNKSMRLLAIFFATQMACIVCKGKDGVADDQLGALVTRPKPVEMTVKDATSSPKKWLNWLVGAYSSVAGKLGSHTFSGKSSLTLTDEKGAVRESLEVESEVKFKDLLHFASRVDNNQDYGARAIVDGEDIYLQHRFGKFHKRKHYGERELNESLLRASSEVAAYLEPFASAIKVSAGDVVSCGAKKCRTLTIAKSKKKLSSSEPWLKNARIISVKGSALVNEQLGFPMKASIEISAEIVREGELWTLVAKASHDIKPGDVTIEVPGQDDWVPTHKRKTEIDERNELLKGLAPAEGVQGQ